MDALADDIAFAALEGIDSLPPDVVAAMSAAPAPSAAAPSAVPAAQSVAIGSVTSVLRVPVPSSGVLEVHLITLEKGVYAWIGAGGDVPSDAGGVTVSMPAPPFSPSPTPSVTSLTPHTATSTPRTPCSSDTVPEEEVHALSTRLCSRVGIPVLLCVSAATRLSRMDMAVLEKAIAAHVDARRAC